MYDNILFPTDGSDGAAAALEHAIEHALTYDASLHILYVVEETIPALEAGAGDVLAKLEGTGQKAVDEAIESATEAGVDSVQGSVGGGSPYRVIREYIDDNDIDMVVMGTHGRRGLDRYLLGSVTEKVVRTSDCPVLTVRADRRTHDESK